MKRFLTSLTTPVTTRRLFLASLVLFAFSLVHSVTNVVTVFSVPLLSYIAIPHQPNFAG